MIALKVGMVTRYPTESNIQHVASKLPSTMHVKSAWY